MFVILTQPKCRYCTLAKEVFQARDLDYSEHEVDVSLREFLRALGLKTVPQIWKVDEYGSYHIGGFDELVAYVKAYIPNKDI